MTNPPGVRSTPYARQFYRPTASCRKAKSSFSSVVESSMSEASPVPTTFSATGDALGGRHLRLSLPRVNLVRWRRIGCMKLQKVEKLLTTRPFVRFGIYLPDGSACPVTHPDQVILTPRVADVGIRSNGNGRVVRDVVICALVHITRLGPVPKAPRKRRK